MKIAVIGSGISGLGAAWALSRVHEVTLFEAQATLGGQARTVEVETGSARMPVDLRPMIFNDLSHPALGSALRALGVLTQPGNLSVSMSNDREQSGYSRAPRKLFSRARERLSPGNWALMREIAAFDRRARQLMAEPMLARLSLGDFLDAGDFSETLARNHILPIAAAIWATSPAQTLAFPAQTLTQMFANHGFIDLARRPEWHTVSGGSREFVKRLSESIRGRIITEAPIVRIERMRTSINVRDERGRENIFDHLVMALPADRSLAILGAGATRRERAILSCFKRQDCEAYLHCDASLMPRARCAWKSANIIATRDSADGQPAFVSYWMNRLQNLPAKPLVFVTSNPPQRPDPHMTFLQYRWRRALFDARAMTAQAQLSIIQGADRIWFCGAWAGYGIAEDGLASGLSVAKALGAPAPFAEQIIHRSPADANCRPEPIVAAMPSAWRFGE